LQLPVTPTFLTHSAAETKGLSTCGWITEGMAKEQMSTPACGLDGARPVCFFD